MTEITTQIQSKPAYTQVQTLIQAAKEILNQNARAGGFTVPSPKLYPFQWLWDSGLVAIGLATYDMERAMSEIETLHSAQWSNGFVPHIIFHTLNEGYYPGPDVHRSDLSDAAPKHVATTGLTQPPVVGFALERMYDLAKDKIGLLPFLKKQFDHVYRFHEYLYTQRDPKKEGLVYIQHNWESGTDNSPVWDEVWKTFEAPYSVLPRKDITHADAEHRPTHRDYEYYIYLIEIFKSVKYDDVQIAQKSPFLIQDPLYNSLLAASNESLARIGERVGASKKQIRQLKQWYRATKKAMNEKLWSNTEGGYLHYDLRNECLINALTISSIVPLFGGIPNQKQANIILKTLLSAQFQGHNKAHFLCPSFNTQDARYNPVKYWRGPVWVHMNWILCQGLRRYGFVEAAETVKNDTLDLIKIYGFWEYYHPNRAEALTDRQGCGGINFSWPAAMVLEWLQE
jgi:Trehalase